MITWHKKNSDPNVSTTLDANGQQQVSSEFVTITKVVVFGKMLCFDSYCVGKGMRQRQIVLEGSANYYNMALSVSVT